MCVQVWGVGWSAKAVMRNPLPFSKGPHKGFSSRDQILNYPFSTKIFMTCLVHGFNIENKGCLFSASESQQPYPHNLSCRPVALPMYHLKTSQFTDTKDKIYCRYHCSRLYTKPILKRREVSLYPGDQGQIESAHFFSTDLL